MIAMRVVRPFVTVRVSGLWSKIEAYGLAALTLAPEAPGFAYGLSVVEVKKLSACWLPTAKLLNCWNGTPGQPSSSPYFGVAKGLQNGTADPDSCGSVSLVP